MNPSPGQTHKTLLSLRYFAWGAVAGWTALVSLLIVVVVLNENNQREERAHAVAKTIFHRDRHWSTLFGEMYLPVTPETETALLASKIPLRFVKTDTGLRLAQLTPLLVRQGGKDLASGVYYAKIQAGTFTATQKMLLMK